MKYLNSSVLKVGESVSQRDNQFARHDNRLNYFTVGVKYEKSAISASHAMLFTSKAKTLVYLDGALSDAYFSIKILI